MDRRPVLIIFGDRTLGGTSRSALTAGQAWTSANIPVVFHPFMPVHPDRKSGFEALGQVIDSLESVDWRMVRAVHLHHGSWNNQLRAFVPCLLDMVEKVNFTGPLIVNNIFAVRDGLLSHWPGQRATTVLGHWAAHQYLAAQANPRNKGRLFVVSNAQDTDQFRPPTHSERISSRQILAFGSKPVVLRIGSPNMDKWSEDYVALADELNRFGATLALAGCPHALLQTLHQFPNVHVLPLTPDDAMLRRYYWASDVFALDALRGESFGNVLLESLLCGIPAVYRERPLRDNTPWEFRDLPGFSMASSRDDWINKVTDHLIDRDGSGVQQPDIDTHTMIEARYGFRSVGRSLGAILLSLEGHAADVELSDLEPANIGRRNSAYIAVRHNPLVTLAKEARLRRRVV